MLLFNIMSDNKVDIGLLSEKQTITPHNDYIYSLLLLDNSHLVSCSKDKTIKVINLQDNTIESTINNAHNRDINYISKLTHSSIVSCSDDKVIKIWNYSNKKFTCVRQINNAHSDIINKVISLSKNRIASCSDDCTIKIFDSELNLIKTLNGHSDSVRSIIQMDNKEYLVSVSFDNTMRFWNLKSLNCESIIDGVSSSGSNCMFQYDKDKIFVGGHNVITIVNVDKMRIEKIIGEEGMGDIRAMIRLRDGSVLCGYGEMLRREGRMCLYDVDNGTFTWRNTTHTNGIMCMVNINEHSFASGAIDSRIILWNY